MTRPTKITEVVVKKLEEAFALGCSDEEACIYANICKQTLYNFQEKNQEFLDRKELLKSKPILGARQAIIKSFNSNPNLALKYLERRKPDEFRLSYLNAFSHSEKETKLQLIYDETFKILHP